MSKDYPELARRLRAAFVAAQPGEIFDTLAREAVEALLPMPPEGEDWMGVSGAQGDFILREDVRALRARAASLGVAPAAPQQQPEEKCLRTCPWCPSHHGPCCMPHGHGGGCWFADRRVSDRRQGGERRVAQKKKETANYVSSHQVVYSGRRNITYRRNRGDSTQSHGRRSLVDVDRRSGVSDRRAPTP